MSSSFCNMRKSLRRINETAPINLVIYHRGVFLSTTRSFIISNKRNRKSETRKESGWRSRNKLWASACVCVCGQTNEWKDVYILFCLLRNKIILSTWNKFYIIVIMPQIADIFSHITSTNFYLSLWNKIWKV